MLLLQVCAHAVGPAAFLERALQRAGLLGGGGLAPPPPGPHPSDERTVTLLEHEPAQLEEMLQLPLLMLKGWGGAEAAALRCALVHQLALGPFAHSVLVRRLEPRWAEHLALDAVLHEAAAKSAQNGKYSLRPHLWRAGWQKLHGQWVTLLASFAAGSLALSWPRPPQPGRLPPRSHSNRL